MTTPAPAARRRDRLSIVAHTREETDAVLAFNERMQAARAPADFLLPDRPNDSHTLGVAPQPVGWTKFVVLDGDDAVRGGFLLMTQPAWVDGDVVEAANYQAPLSEGIIDARYGMVGMHMLRYVQAHWPYVFAVGMGGLDRPLPRLLQAAGWRVEPVPFLVHVVQPARVLRELRVFQQRPAMRLAARVGAATGLGAIGVAALQHRAWTSRAPRDLQLDRVERWGDWANTLWERTRAGVTFSVMRGRTVLDCLYPLNDPRYVGYVARRGGDVVGWAVALDTPMVDHRHFGTLRVATVLDAVALPDAATAVACHLRRALSRTADLVVTNQTHDVWIDAFRRAGFLGAPSNYLLAMSKRLSVVAGGRLSRVHVTRGDGDGRIHL